MDINEYRELKERVEEFETLWIKKEECEDYLKKLREYKNEEKGFTVNIGTIDSRFIISGDISKKICCSIATVLEDEVRNISSEIEKL